MNGNGSENEGDSGSTENVYRLFGYLAERLSNGWLYFVSAKHLHNAYESGRVSCSRLFFMATYQACLDRSIQVIRDVVYGEEATLPRLLAAAEGAPNSFTHATPGVVRARAGECSSLMAGLNGQIEQLHIARSRLLVPSEDDLPDSAVLEAFSIGQLMGLQKAYRDVLSMVTEFAGYYDSPGMHLKFVEEIIQDDVDFLMTLMSGNCV